MLKAGHEITLFTSEFRYKREEVVDGTRIARNGGACMHTIIACIR